VFTHLQALQDDFICAGRDTLFFRHPLVSAVRKAKTRYEGRVQGRKRLQNQKDLLTGEIVRKGIERFIPEGIDLRGVAPDLADLAQGMLAGLLTFNWPSIRLSNSGVDITWRQAQKAASKLSHDPL
jgi:hypothetical protein